MTEDQLEQETLAWLTDAGYCHRYGLDIAPDGSAPQVHFRIEFYWAKLRRGNFHYPSDCVCRQPDRKAGAAAAHVQAAPSGTAKGRCGWLLAAYQLPVHQEGRHPSFLR